MKYIEEFKAFLNTFQGLEVQDQLQQYNVFNLLNEYNYIESERTVPDFLRYDLAAFSGVLDQVQAPASKAEAKALFEQIIDGTVPCVNPADGDYISQGDYRNMLHAILPLSLVLAHDFPAFFMPYFYRYKFKQLKQIAEACDITLPALPKAGDLRGRCMYYWEICEAFYDFRIKYDMISIELWAFLFYFAPMCIPMMDLSVQLPAPTNVWWIGKREGIDEYRDTTLMHIRLSARKGDVVVRYEAAPTQQITTLWRVLTDADTDPLDPNYSYAYIGKKSPVTPLGIAALKSDTYFAQHPLAKRRFLQADGYKLSEEDWKQLKQLLNITDSL